MITDYPLKVDNAWGQFLFDIPNTKVIMKCKPVEKYKAIKRIDNSILYAYISWINSYTSFQSLTLTAPRSAIISSVISLLW